MVLTAERQPGAGAQDEALLGGGRGRAPHIERLAAKHAMGWSGDEMSLNGEGVADGRWDGDDALGGAVCLERLHLPFSPSHRQGRRLDPVVFFQSPGLEAVGAAESAGRRPIPIKTVRDDGFGAYLSALQDAALERPGPSLVAALLDEDIENLACVVDGAPHVHPHASDLHDHFIEAQRGVAARNPIFSDSWPIAVRWIVLRNDRGWGTLLAWRKQY